MESEIATAADFSYFGADRTIIGPESERFVPAFPSLTCLQSDQMLLSHSNEMSIHKNSAVPIHPAQFSREIYDMGSTQYNNMNFLANLEAPGAKTAVYAKRSMPVYVDKRCAIQDSLHSLGGNWEAISNSQSNSASDEADDQQVINVRKKRRMLSNRESARRSRLRKQQHLDELRAQVAHLRAENGQIMNNFNIFSQHHARITEENCLLRSEALELSHKLERLHHTINAQSHGAFKTMSIENGNCGVAHLSSESSTIAQSLLSPDLLF
jgi:hypothetical protein